MIDTDQIAEARGMAVPPLPVPSDHAPDAHVVALVDAARIIVDNARQGAKCYRRWADGATPHTLGTNTHCAICQLAKALEAFA